MIARKQLIVKMKHCLPVTKRSNLFIMKSNLKVVLFCLSEFYVASNYAINQFNFIKSVPKIKPSIPLIIEPIISSEISNINANSDATLYFF